MLFLAESVLHLSDTQAGVLSEGIRAGDTLTTRLPPGATSVRLSDPSGTVVNLEPAPNGSVTYGPITTTGMYVVSWEGQATATDQADGSTARRHIAVNLLDPYESDVGTVSTLSMAREEVKAQGSRRSDLARSSGHTCLWGRWRS